MYQMDANRNAQGGRGAQGRGGGGRGGPGGQGVPARRRGRRRARGGRGRGGQQPQQPAEVPPAPRVNAAGVDLDALARMRIEAYNRRFQRPGQARAADGRAQQAHMAHVGGNPGAGPREGPRGDIDANRQVAERLEQGDDPVEPVPPVVVDPRLGGAVDAAVRAANQADAAPGLPEQLLAELEARLAILRREDNEDAETVVQNADDVGVALDAEPPAGEIGEEVVDEFMLALLYEEHQRYLAGQVALIRRRWLEFRQRRVNLAQRRFVHEYEIDIGARPIVQFEMGQMVPGRVLGNARIGTAHSEGEWLWRYCPNVRPAISAYIDSTPSGAFLGFNVPPGLYPYRYDLPQGRGDPIVEARIRSLIATIKPLGRAMKRKFKLVEVYAKQDSSVLFYVLLTMAVISAILVRFRHWIEYEGWLWLAFTVAVLVAVLSQWVNFGDLRHLQFLGTRSRAALRPFGSTWSWNVITGRANYFYGSGYVTTWKVIVRADILAQMMTNHFSTRVSTTMKNSCRQTALVLFEEEIERYARTSFWQYSFMMRMIDHCAYYITQRLELGTVLDQHTTSNLTVTALVDQDFRSGGASTGTGSLWMRTGLGRPPLSR